MPSPEHQNHENENSKLEMQRIQTLVSDLKALEPSNPSDRNENVDTALKVTRDVFSPHKEWFLENKIIPTIHGSLLYHDPIGLDLDVTFFYIKPPEDFFIDQQRYWSIEQSFEGRPNPLYPDYDLETNFSVVEPARFERELQQIEQRVVEPASGDDFSSMFLGQILTSELLYREQTEEFEKLKKSTLMRLQESPLLRQGVLKELEGVQKDRLDNSRRIKK